MLLLNLRTVFNKSPDIVMGISTSLFFPKNFKLKEERDFISTIKLGFTQSIYNSSVIIFALAFKTLFINDFI